jgi:sarcosine oxidase, subunit beta
MADQTHEVIVIGGGVMGAATLYYLSRLGITDALLIEREGLASGSTGRSAAILRSHYSNAVTTLMSMYGRDVIANFEEEVGAPGGFVKTGYFFLVSQDKVPGLRRNVGIGRQLGLNTELLSPDEAISLMPDGFELDGIAAVAHEPESGYADSSAVTSGFVTAARRVGAWAEVGEPVTGLLVDRGRVMGIETPAKRVYAERVVLCAGPWTNDLLMSAGAPLPLTFVRHQVVVLRRPMDRLPMLPIVADEPGGFSFRPDSADTTLVTIKEDPAERESYNQNVDTEVAVLALELMSRRHAAFAEAGWDGGWSGLFTITPDWHPVIDAVPGVDGLFVGAGFSGHGFKMSPAIGRALAEMTIDGSSHSIDISPLRFTRFTEGDLVQSSYGVSVFA